MNPRYASNIAGVFPLHVQRVMVHHWPMKRERNRYQAKQESDSAPAPVQASPKSADSTPFSDKDPSDPLGILNNSSRSQPQQVIQMKRRNSVRQDHEESTENAPLFPDMPLTKVRGISLHGVIQDEQGEETAVYIDMIAPNADASYIQREFGGGSFILKATGENHQQLDERQITIAGPALWTKLLQSEEDKQQQQEQDQRFGRRFGSSSDPRRDPRFADPRFADPRFADPRFADPRIGDPRFNPYQFGGPPWRPQQQSSQQEQIVGKLLDAMISSRAPDPSALKGELESLRMENDRLRSQISRLQSDEMDIRSRFNSAVEEERTRASRRIKESEETCDRFREELNKERQRAIALERKIMEYELHVKFADKGKDGSGGFNMESVKPMLPFIGAVAMKWLGIDAETSGQAVSESQHLVENPATSIPGIPS